MPKILIIGCKAESTLTIADIKKQYPELANEDIIIQNTPIENPLVKIKELNIPFKFDTFYKNEISHSENKQNWEIEKQIKSKKVFKLIQKRFNRIRNNLARRK